MLTDWGGIPEIALEPHNSSLRLLFILQSLLIILFIMAEFLTFIRHTLTEAKPGICYGESDVALAGTYRNDMNRVLKKLKPYQPQFIVSSPLKRCKKLASLIEKHYQLPFQIDDRIKEASFGEWELKPWNDINRSNLIDWTKNYVNIPPPGGESFNMVLDRFDPFWNELWQKEEKEIFVVTHNGILRTALVKALNLTPRQVFSFNLSFGAVIRIKKVEPGFYSLQIL